MFLLENNRILTKDRVFQIEYKKPLDEFLDGHWVSHYCSDNVMVEIGNGSLIKCIKAIHAYAKSPLMSTQDYVEKINQEFLIVSDSE